MGAGTSAGAGAPVMSNFLDVARDQLLNPLSPIDPDFKADFERVFAYVYKLKRAQAHVEIDLGNIEDVFGLVDLECRLGKEEAISTRKALVRLIVETLECSIDFSNPWRGKS